MYFRENKLNKNIIGIAVSKKNGKAVRRNRLKRLIRESYQHQKNNLKQGYSMVFLWNKQKLDNYKCSQIEDDMIKLFEKADILI